MKLEAEGVEYANILSSPVFKQWKVRTIFGNRMLFQLVPGDFSYLNLNNSNSNWKREIIGIQRQPRKVRKLWFCKNCLLCFSYPRNVTDFLCCRFLCVASSTKKTRKWKPDLVLWSSPCLYKNAGILRFLWSKALI